jgi:hypothetical protein
MPAMPSSSLPPSAERVRRHTDPHIQDKIDRPGLKSDRKPLSVDDAIELVAAAS